MLALVPRRAQDNLGRAVRDRTSLRGLVQACLALALDQEAADRLWLSVLTLVLGRRPGLAPDPEGIDPTLVTDQLVTVQAAIGLAAIGLA